VAKQKIMATMKGITINHCGTVVLHGVASLQKAAMESFEKVVCSGKNMQQQWTLACALALLQKQKSNNQQEKRKQQ